MYEHGSHKVINMAHFPGSSLLKIFLEGKKVGNAKHFYIKTNADNIE